MAVVVKYGSYQFPDDSLPVITFDRNLDFDSDGNATTERLTVTLEGHIDGSSPAVIWGRWDDLLAAFTTSKQDFLFQTDGVDRITLLAADSINGPIVTKGPGIPDGANAMGATHIPYAITIDSTQNLDDDDGSGGIDGVTKLEQRTRFEFDKFSLQRRTFSGALETIEGVSALSKFDGLDPGVPSGWQRESKSKEKDKGDQKLEFEYVDVQLSIANPAGIKDATRTVSESIRDGIKTIRITGSYIADERDKDIAKARAKAERPTGKTLLVEDLDVEEHSGTATFAYEYEEAAKSGSYHFHVESASFTKTVHNAWMKVKRSGTPDYKQIASNPTYEASVQGERRSKLFYPTPAPHVYSQSDLDGSETIDREYKLSANGQAISEYITRWSRRYRFASSRSIQSPAAP